MNKDDWKEIIIITLTFLVFISFAFLFIYVVEYQKVEVENKFLKEKIEEQKVIIEKMEQYKE
jgi:cell shape-determining protein MreC